MDHIEVYIKKYINNHAKYLADEGNLYDWVHNDGAHCSFSMLYKYACDYARMQHQTNIPPCVHSWLNYHIYPLADYKHEDCCVCDIMNRYTTECDKMEVYEAKAEAAAYNKIKENKEYEQEQAKLDKD